MSVLRFGVIADPQYADKDSKSNAAGDCQNSYRGALQKLVEAVEVLSREKLEFVAVMGDLVDWEASDLPPVMERLGRLKAPLVMVLGNHDVRALGKDTIGAFGANEKAARALEMPGRYYTKDFGKYRVVVLDTNEGFLVDMLERRKLEANLMEKCGNEMDYWLTSQHVWNGFVMEAQQEWLRGQLKEAREVGKKVILMGHDPIYPHGGESLRNAREVLKIIAEYPEVVVAGFAGHNHYGGYAKFGWAPFITFKGMLVGEETAFSVVEISEEGLRTKGFGRENSYQFVRGA